MPYCTETAFPLYPYDWCCLSNTCQAPQTTEPLATCYIAPVCSTGSDCVKLKLSPPSNVCLNGMCSTKVGLSMGAIIGISVGAFVLVAGGIGLAVFLVMKSKRRAAASDTVYAQEAHNPLVVVVN